MSQPDGDPGASEPLARFLGGLHDHFATYRPQGSPRWNFGAAFRRLEEAWGRTFAADRAKARGEEPAPGAPPTPARPRSFRQALDRVQSLGGRSAADAAPADERTEEGFDATLEALRFLAARVDQLERTAAADARPLEGMAWFEPDDASSLLVADVAGAVREHDGAVLHVECGGGDLLAALHGAGVDARGVEPRGELALAAAQRGLTVEVGDAATTVAALPPGSEHTIVLSGVVDTEPVTRLVTLLDAALGALAPGGLLVVVSRGPKAVAGWSPVALDLLPGRPLHRETWELLLDRAGALDVRAVGGTGEPGGPFALSARRG